MFGFSSFAELAFSAIKDAVEPIIHATMGGLPPKKVKTKFKKNQRDEIAEIVRQAFAELETIPVKVVKAEQKAVKKEIAKVDLADYDFALEQINRLLLQSKSRLQNYEAEMFAEIEDEESLLMLI